MIEQTKSDVALRGISRAPLTQNERAQLGAVLARRFAGFDMPQNASKAEVIEALVQHLLARQRRG